MKTDKSMLAQNIRHADYAAWFQAAVTETTTHKLMSKEAR